MKGRKPTPIEIRAATGNPQRRPLPTPRVVGGRSSGAPSGAPDHFTDHQAAVYREAKRLLVDGGVYDLADEFAVEAFAQAMGRAREIREFLMSLDAGNGRLLADTVRGTWTANPLLAKETEALREARLYGEVLGLNAVSRTRLGLRDKRRTGLAAIVGGSRPTNIRKG